MQLSAYKEYKDSGIRWLGEIPAHWELRRAKYILREKDGRWQESKGNLLSVSQYTGVTERIKKEGSDEPDTRAESLVGYKIADKDDLVVNIMLAWNGSLGVSPTQGLVSPAYCVYGFREGNPHYYHSLLRSNRYRAEIKRRSRGVVDSRLRLYTDDLFRLPLLKPMDEEQIHIARFLDWQSAQINQFIRNKRRLTDLLKEQKQNIINQVVTRGLDPSVKFKPSGVEWIGDIPAHWSVAPLKYLADINARVLPESTDESYAFKYIDISSIGTGYMVTEPESLRFGHAPSRARRVLKKGDTIVSTVRTYLKAAYYVSEEVENWIASTGFAALTPRKEIHPPFLGLLIQSNSFIDRVIRESVGVTYPAIAETSLGGLHLAYPTRIAEQKEILAYLTDSAKAINHAITRAEREIELILEYRTRLISDVVTGHVDVRGIEVPEIAEEGLLAPVENGDEISGTIGPEPDAEAEE